jgi:hypothetical protein
MAALRTTFLLAEELFAAMNALPPIWGLGRPLTSYLGVSGNPLRPATRFAVFLCHIFPFHPPLRPYAVRVTAAAASAPTEHMPQ